MSMRHGSNQSLMGIVSGVLQILIKMNFRQLAQLTKGLWELASKPVPNQHSSTEFKPTSFLSHPFLQSVYNLAEPTLDFQMSREKIFFEDGGHIALDWSHRTEANTKPPVLFIMHGLTGGSEMNYIRALMNESVKKGYQCVCLNSRGINTEMTSPIPFTALQFHELSTSLERVETDYPDSPIYLVGTSFGGNYLIRYLLKHHRPSIKGLIALAPPLNINQVVDDMSPIYQRFFVKRYIYETVQKHAQMKYWEKIGLVNMREVYKSTTLRQFHEKITVKILGLSDTDELFDQYRITAEMIKSLGIKTLFMVSKDDPIVSYSSMPVEAICSNPNITFMATEKGGHLCWFSGSIPKRWYPQPTLDFLHQLRNQADCSSKQN